MLVSRRALGLVLAEADDVAAAAAALASEHRETPMVARTLLQHAVPTTFGLKAAGWLTAIVEARLRLEQISQERLAAQLGGAAGTLAGFGDGGIALLDLFAHELDLQVPTVPWHTNRTRIAELGAALTTTAGVASKIALDLLLLAQTEVAEVAEGGGAGRSSTMPQKRNPVGSALTRASARLAAAQAGVLVASLEQEHERAAGAWQAEWEALTGALAFTGGALHSLAGALESLEVDAVRMRRNLDATGGLVLAERIAFMLVDRLGRAEAQEVVREAAAAESFRDALLDDPRVGLGPAELDAALDPTRPISGRPPSSSTARSGSTRARGDRARSMHEPSPPDRRTVHGAAAHAVQLARGDARDVGSTGIRPDRAAPARALRPARPRTLAGAARAPIRSRISGGTRLPSSTTSASNASRSAASRSAG